MHTWKAGGSNGAWVLHSSKVKGGDASDSIGVGFGEDILGPFSTGRRSSMRTQAEVVADALQNAYAAGKRDGRAELSFTAITQRTAVALREIREAAARVVAEYRDPDSWYMSADSMALLGDTLPDGMVDDYRRDLAAENRAQTSEKLDDITERVQEQNAEDARRETEAGNAGLGWPDDVPRHPLS